MLATSQDGIHDQQLAGPTAAARSSAAPARCVASAARASAAAADAFAAPVLRTSSCQGRSIFDPPRQQHAF